MRIAHAAALALVVWYLIVPPPDLGSTPRTPINQWSAWKGFDSEAECERAHDKMASDAQKTLDDPKASQRETTTAWEFLAAACIATDDPPAQWQLK
jgi:hypothetical protein